MKKFMKLPNDIKKYCAQRALIRVAAFALLMAVGIVFITLFGDKVFVVNDKEKYSGVKILAYIAILAVPFVVSGVPHKLIDKSYCGTVKRTWTETASESVSIDGETTDKLYTKNSIYIQVEAPDGSTFEKMVYKGPLGDRVNLDTYKEGDRVVHLYGRKHTTVLPRPSDTYCKCSICETVNEVSNDTCRACGRTLIKDLDMLE